MYRTGEIVFMNSTGERLCIRLFKYTEEPEQKETKIY